MSERTSSTTDLALVAVFAALVSVLSLIPAINVGVGVPITLQTLGVALAGLVLGPWRGFTAVLLYLVIGLIGLPVFAGGAAGIGSLGKPSAGYLLSFPIAALVAGLLARALLRTRLPMLLALFLAGFGASILIVHPAGILGLMANAGMSLDKAILTDLVFWPGDIVKNVLAAAITATVFRAFPALRVGRRRTPREQPVT
ncbi:biotin transporter BioY [Enemella evansiae]|uniref:biotin transporter BioY n=1 Tax=Enemella evansiae TaxID=2016499 RepID=UPI00105BB4C4|nr:biotin transporter BioY [Enemella evansiae]TDO89953.1 biotin transport system substrate-specific component [Enemella evansiae]